MPPPVTVLGSWPFKTPGDHANLTANHILTIKMRSVSFLLMTKRSSCANDYNAE